MTTEAEQLAKQVPLNEQALKVARELDDFNASLDRKAAALLRSQAAEIERLREILARALAQMRTQRRIDRAEFPSEAEDEIRIELGERV